jgi:hypothetical protein
MASAAKEDLTLCCLPFFHGDFCQPKRIVSDAIFFIYELLAA